MGDTLLFAVEIDDRITGGFTACACSGWNGDEFYARVLVFLLQVKFVLVHLAEKLDALGHINTAAATYGKDGVAMGPLKQIHSFANITIKGIGGELVKHHIGHFHLFNTMLNAEKRKTAVAYKQEFGGAFEGFAEVVDSIDDCLHDRLFG